MKKRDLKAFAIIIGLISCLMIYLGRFSWELIVKEYTILACWLWIYLTMERLAVERNRSINVWVGVGAVCFWGVFGLAYLLSKSLLQFANQVSLSPASFGVCVQAGSLLLSVAFTNIAAAYLKNLHV
jgi:hypothetical protein